MNTWKTILRVNNIQDAFTIQAQLELEGFEVNILDELSSNYTPHFSAITGGVRIQVLEQDVENAIAILKNLGHIPELEEKRNNRLFASILKLTSRIPFINKMRKEAQLLLFVIGLFALIIFPIAIMNIPKEESFLVNSMWCIEEVKHKGEIITPFPQSFSISVNGCSNDIFFSGKTRLSLPPYGDSTALAMWDISDNYIHIRPNPHQQNKGPNNLFFGKFRYTKVGRKLRLKSNNTSILLVRI